VRLLQTNYSQYIRANGFKQLTELRLHVQFTNLDDLIEELPTLERIERIIVEVSSKLHHFMPTATILHFIQNLPRSVDEFRFKTPRTSVFDSAGTSNNIPKKTQLMFAKFFERVICEMHKKFQIPLTNGALRAFLNLPLEYLFDFRHLYENFLGLQFMNGHLYLCFFFRRLLKVEVNPFKFLRQEVIEYEKFEFTMHRLGM